MNDEARIKDLTVGEFNKVVQKAVKEHRCPIPADAAEEVGHFFGMVEDIGEGDIRKGIEAVREHHKFIKSMSSVRNKIGTVIITLITLTVGGSILAFIWKGIKDSVVK